jgi:hypothetical protein
VGALLVRSKDGEGGHEAPPLQMVVKADNFQNLMTIYLKLVRSRISIGFDLVIGIFSCGGFTLTVE